MHEASRANNIYVLHARGLCVCTYSERPAAVDAGRQLSMDENKSYSITNTR